MLRACRVSPGLLATLLAGLAVIGPFAVDTYLPSFPAIQADLSVSALQVQQSLSLDLLGFAVMTLFPGTISDSFGRKPVILANLFLFVLASLGCAWAASFEQLLLFRAMQGLSAGAGIVIGRAVIRDSVEGHAAQRLMSLVTMIFGVAPAIAPVIGGWLQAIFGWRAIFVFLGTYGLLLLIACHARLPETLSLHQRHPFALGPLARNYWKLGRSFPLFLLSTAIALNFCGFFLYIVSAPAFIYNLLHLAKPSSRGSLSPASLASRPAPSCRVSSPGKLPPRSTVHIGYAVMFSAVAFNLVYSAFVMLVLPWSVVPMMVYASGMALAMPSITLLALELFPLNRGLTSSLQRFEHSFPSSVVAGVVAPLVSHAAVTLARSAWVCNVRSVGLRGCCTCIASRGTSWPLPNTVA